MERVISQDVSPPYLSLITGPPGSMKTSFSLSIISNHLRRTGSFGLYCTVEETVDSLLKTCNSMGLELPPNLQITDLTELRKENESMDYTERQPGEFAELQGNEGFIADGIINLGLDRRNGKIVRTMQIEKMRHIRHSMEKQAIDISPGGVTVLGPLFD